MNAFLAREELCGLIPHQGAMCLLDSVHDWDDAGIHCSALSHRDPQHPLAREGRLAAVHLIEYGAQAMAVHGGLLARKAGLRAAPGFLASMRGVKLEVAHLHDIDAALDIRAQRLLADAGGGWLYAFSAHAGARLLAEGRLAVIARS